MDQLRQMLLHNYRAGQGQISSASVYSDVCAFWPYYERNYRTLLPSRDAAVLEVGTGHGGLLAWLRSQGIENIEGVDASPGDVEYANTHLGEGVVKHGDAVEFLNRSEKKYDLIITKAVLEHIPKHELYEFVSAMCAALTPKGRLIIDVPNMDWVSASHERYMDLTHEIGFTKQSLESLLQMFFEDFEVIGSQPACLTRSQKLFRKPVIYLYRKFLYILGEGGEDIMFASRSLIGNASRAKCR
ncbi:putative methyltransferase type 12 [Tepidicaulis marinus]|uniref:Putative methyltransferase type 12 n=1 Tax=Tepidicaulis marinus TaxID=1333998 RepID=A0A081BDR0_9HYPH|nr:class I SAM-dependent methyltransferase [Tepidicaulis marinus]GAK46178.1 putative methyltransferase type 12 [Tepidicaulis marinus]